MKHKERQEPNTDATGGSERGLERCACTCITGSCTSHRMLSRSLCRVTGLWVLFKPRAWASWIGLKALHLTSTAHFEPETTEQKTEGWREKERDQGTHARERKAKGPGRIPRSWVLASYCSSNIHVFDSNLKIRATKLEQCNYVSVRGQKKDNTRNFISWMLFQ